MTDHPNRPSPGEGEAEEDGRPTVRDKRRIDPQTYQLRDDPAATPAEGAADGAPAGSPDPSGQIPPEQPRPEQEESEELAEVKQQLADRTADLQRLQAEYVNYKRRVDRDRDLARAGGVESVMQELLPVLDSLRSAREHEELTGGFKAVAEEIERLAAKHGLEAFGEAGDPFDPHIHEALMHAEASGLSVPTCVTVLQPGYRLQDRVIRPARVAVAQPDGSAQAEQPVGAEQPAATADQDTGADQEAGHDGSDTPYGTGEPVDGPGQ